MGGTVEARSEVDQGSTFSFSARFGPATDAPSELAASSRHPTQAIEVARSVTRAPTNGNDPAAEVTPVATNGNRPAAEATVTPPENSPPPPDETGVPLARVLVAEDNPVNQAVAVKMLERAGVSADVAHDGRQAVEMLAGDNYSAVFMDCQMPRLDGYGATAEIRRLEGSERSTPIIAMTAHAMKGDRERCIEAGMDDYLAKPVRPAQLREMIDRWVTRDSYAGGGAPEAGD